MTIRFDRLGGASEYLMGRIRGLVDKHSNFLEHVTAGDGLIAFENALGGITFEIDGSSRPTFSGIIWHNGVLKWDLNRVDCLPEEELSPVGLFELDAQGNYVGYIAAEYLKVNLETGEFEQADGSDGDESAFEYFKVADFVGIDASQNPIYGPSARTAGDIHVRRGGAGAWSGRASLFYGDGAISIDVADAVNILGTHIACYLGVSSSSADIVPSGGTQILSTRFSWVDGPQQAPWLTWVVAEEVLDGGSSFTPKRYALVSGRTVGDIRVPLPIPAHPYMVIQQGSGLWGDNGIVGEHARAHA